MTQGPRTGKMANIVPVLFFPYPIAPQPLKVKRKETGLT